LFYRMDGSTHARAAEEQASTREISNKSRFSSLQVIAAQRGFVRDSCDCLSPSRLVLVEGCVR